MIKSSFDRIGKKKGKGETKNQLKGALHSLCIPDIENAFKSSTSRQHISLLSPLKASIRGGKKKLCVIRTIPKYTKHPNNYPHFQILVTHYIDNDIWRQGLMWPMQLLKNISINPNSIVVQTKTSILGVALNFQKVLKCAEGFQILERITNLQLKNLADFKVHVCISDEDTMEIKSETSLPLRLFQ